MTDKEVLAQYSSEYLANSLVDCRYLCDSFEKTIATLRQELKTNQSFIDDWNEFFPDMGPREIKALIDKLEDV